MLGFTCSVPLAPETHSHSRVAPGRGSGSHHHTHNNFPLLPGPQGCLPRECPVPLYLQLLARQLADARCTGSVTARTDAWLSTPARLSRSLQGWLSLWTAALHPFSIPAHRGPEKMLHCPTQRSQSLKDRKNAAESNRTHTPEREFNLLPHLQRGSSSLSTYLLGARH